MSFCIMHTCNYVLHIQCSFIVFSLWSYQKQTKKYTFSFHIDSYLSPFTLQTFQNNDKKYLMQLSNLQFSSLLSIHLKFYLRHTVQTALTKVITNLLTPWPSHLLSEGWILFLMFTPSRMFVLLSKSMLLLPSGFSLEFLFKFCIFSSLLISVSHLEASLRIQMSSYFYC